MPSRSARRPRCASAQAAAALKAGKHVLLEKPPGATVSELDAADRRAHGKAGERCLRPGIPVSRRPSNRRRTFLAGRQIKSVVVEWKEDVRVWHPGQAWIWEPGGLGVFDPGINALSILTRILPRPFFLTTAELSFPRNRAAPIAADLAFSDEHRSADPGRIRLAPDRPADLGHPRRNRCRAPDARPPAAAVSSHDDRTLVDEKQAEYRGIYRRFVELIASG